MLRQAGLPVDELPDEVLQMVVSGLMQKQGLPGEGADQALEMVEDGMVMFYDHTEESDPTYVDWMAERGLKPASQEAVPTFHRLIARSEPQALDAREARSLTLTLEALNQFFSAKGTEIVSLIQSDRSGNLVLTGRVEYMAHIGDARAKEDRLAVKISLSPEGFA